MRPIRCFGAVILAIILISIPSVLFAQEYSVFGEISLEAVILETPHAVQRNRLDSLLGVELNHRLDYEKFSFIAHHRASMDRTEEPEHTLYEAYVDYRPSDRVSIGAGKQRVSWGRGITFFPTDTLHPSHTRDDVEGFKGISTLITPTPDLQLTGAVDFSAPLGEDYSAGSANEDFWAELKYALYGSWFLGNLDLALSGVYRRDETLRPGLGLSYDFAGFILTAEGSIEFLNQTLYPDESASEFSGSEAGEPYPLAAAGISRSWMPKAISDFSLYAAAEYLYAGIGYGEEEAKRYFELDPAEPTAAYLGRHYLFLLGSLELYQTVSVEISGLTNIQDGSCSLGASVTLLTIAGMDLTTEGEMLVGNSTTEFGSLKPAEGAWSLSVKSTLYF